MGFGVSFLLVTFLWTSKDKFDGIEFGQPKAARRARTMDGPSLKSLAVGQPPTSISAAVGGSTKKFGALR